ncbi:MAG: hypothetical protein JWM16_20 [Verrucomicrobiales bacterium]|nr:hypothetical protein [Verrucomicrobiales bacterium]
MGRLHSAQHFSNRLASQSFTLLRQASARTSKAICFHKHGESECKGNMKTVPDVAGISTSFLYQKPRGARMF